VPAEAAADRDPVRAEQDQRAHDRCDNPGSAAGGSVPTGGAPNEAGDKRPGQTEEDRHEKPAWILARHDELCERADDEPNDEHP